MSSAQRTQRSESRWRGTGGYSLVELITVTGLISLLLAAALPQFDSRRQDVNTVMRQLIGDFRTARTRAITSGVHFSVTMAASNTLKMQRHQEVVGTWPVASVSETVALPGTVSFWMTPDTLEFNTRGQMISATAPVFVYVTDAVTSHVHAFSVWPSGQVTEEY